MGHNHAQAQVARYGGRSGEGQPLQAVHDVGAVFIQRFGQDGQSGAHRRGDLHEVLRWALPGADRACQGQAGRVAVPGGASRMQVRAAPRGVPPLSTVRATPRDYTPAWRRRLRSACGGTGAADRFIDDALRHLS